MTAVSRSTIKKDIYNAMYALITGSITDSQSPVRSVTKWNFAAWPNIPNLSESDFPIIVFDKPSITTQNFTVRRSRVNWLMVITVYTVGDKSAEKSNTLTDQIYDIIRGAKYSNLRNDKKLHNTEVLADAEDVVKFGEVKTHIATLTIGGQFIHSDF